MNGRSRVVFLAFVFLIVASAASATVPIHEWSQRFGDTGVDLGNDVAVDGSGNVVVTGGFTGTVDFGGGPLVGGAGLNYDIFLAKYDANGAHLWSKHFGVGAAASDQGTGVAVDASGNVFVTGFFNGTVDFGGGNLVSAGGPDIFLAKYDANGVHQWSQSFGNNLVDRGWGIAVDASNNVIVTGEFESFVSFGGGNLLSAGNADIFVAKYDANGTHLWSKRFGNTSDDIGFDVATDASDNAVVTGAFVGSVDFGGGALVSAGNFDIFLAKYDANGVHQWSQRFGDAGGNPIGDRGYAVAADALGNVIATGVFQGTVNFGGGSLVSAGERDVWLAKYDASGTHLWSKRFGDTLLDAGMEVAFDPVGNAVVTGSFHGTVDFGAGNVTSAGFTAGFIARYDACGVHQWSYTFGDTVDAIGRGVAVDALGDVIATGYFWGTADFGGGSLASAGASDIFIARYDDEQLDFVVTTDQDAGCGSLREAIVWANAFPDTSRITFAVPGSAPVTIQLQTSLPAITAPVTIDGYTQPGASPNTNACGMGLNAVPGVAIDGSAVAGTADGIVLAGDNSTVSGLTINGFSRFGIFVTGDFNHIEGNFIGSDPGGTLAVPNGSDALRVAGQYNTIGGSTPDARNLLSGNGGAGVTISSISNTVAGNLIGTDVSGTSALPNHRGVSVGTSSGVTVGGLETSECNVISGNTRDGILAVDSDVLVTGNYIGTDVTGTAPLGNGDYGVSVGVVSLTARVEIGTGVPGEGNVIAYNGLDGVFVDPFAIVSGDHIIRANSIHSNGDLGIDLLADGVTPVGTAFVQDYPILTAVVTGPASTTIDGTVDGPANVDLTLDFFSSGACDGSGHGEGEVYLGTAIVSTDGGGSATFSETLPIAVPPGAIITASATDTSLTRTSEFSACLAAVNTPAGSNVVVEPVDETTATTPVTVTFDEVTTGGNTTLTTTTSGPPPPGGFAVCGSTWYDLGTDVGYTGLIEVCIEYDEGCVTGAESDMTIMHYDSTDTWVDITTMVDTTNNVVCGETTTLSPFAAMFGETATGIRPSPSPTRPALYPAVPNPFNPVTTIAYDLPPGGGRVTITVYDVAGRAIRTLVDGFRGPGRRSVVWDGRDERGALVASGVYFYRMKTGAFAQTRKMLLLK